MNLFLSCASHQISAQVRDQGFTLDSTYITRDHRWSLRAYSVIKFQTITLTNKQNNESIRYFPRNPIGVGIGFAYRDVIIDLGINLKLDKSNTDPQADFQGSVFTRGEVFDFFIQRYRGFRGHDFTNEIERFRDDIETFALGMNYFHSFNARRLSLASAFHGVAFQKKSTGTFGLGGYFSFYKMEADSSIIPPTDRSLFNAYARITESRFSNVGLTLGYAYSLVLPNNHFVFAAIFPGIGLNFGRINTEERYDPKHVPAGKINYRVAVGRATQKYYIILSYIMDNFLVDIGNENRYRYSLGKIKLVVGFRMKSKLKQVDKILKEV